MAVGLAAPWLIAGTLACTANGTIGSITHDAGRAAVAADGAVATDAAAPGAALDAGTSAPAVDGGSTPVGHDAGTHACDPARHHDAVSSVGSSVDGLAIERHVFGAQASRGHLVIIGGIHGAYERNGSELAEALIAHYAAHAASVPSGVTLHIVPRANPDALARALRDGATDLSVTESDGFPRYRPNVHGIDLNRNFACNHQPSTEWGGLTFPSRGGTHAESEPEARALADFFRGLAADGSPVRVVSYHSMITGGAIYSADCPAPGGTFTPTAGSDRLASTYAARTAYAYAGGTFASYAITGDLTDWLSTLGIDGITVEFPSRAAPPLDAHLAALGDIMTAMASPDPGC